MTFQKSLPFYTLVHEKLYCAHYPQQYNICGKCNNINIDIKLHAARLSSRKPIIMKFKPMPVWMWKLWCNVMCVTLQSNNIDININYVKVLI